MLHHPIIAVDVISFNLVRCRGDAPEEAVLLDCCMGERGGGCSHRRPRQQRLSTGKRHAVCSRGTHIEIGPLATSCTAVERVQQAATFCDHRPRYVGQDTLEVMRKRWLDEVSQRSTATGKRRTHTHRSAGQRPSGPERHIRLYVPRPSVSMPAFVKD